ncbi:L-threonine 3-dehydrogenase [Pararobbsia alpina]|uniref:L-threonine 3-dehydrogenase n=1 Tax=Pararobbsia alpina TaxID=621374 RepID=A0A6S7BNJ0_9BURK|nr:L-threonine 3-dehydrogenase [Pararobbsia alpina]
MAAMMKAAVFVEPGRIELSDKPIPGVGPNDALIRITSTPHKMAATSSRWACAAVTATRQRRAGGLATLSMVRKLSTCWLPDAQANLAPIPNGLSDEQVLMCPDIMSTGFKGAENANIKIGDTVAVFAQGPIGLCATAGARLLGATTIIAVDGNDQRLAVAGKMGADVTLNFKKCDVVDEIMKLTGGRGVDSSIEALGIQAT